MNLLFKRKVSVADTLKEYLARYLVVIIVGGILSFLLIKLVAYINGIVSGFANETIAIVVVALIMLVLYTYILAYYSEKEFLISNVPMLVIVSTLIYGAIGLISVSNLLFSISAVIPSVIIADMLYLRFKG